MEIRHLFSRMNKLKVFILIACLVDISASERLLDSHPGKVREVLDRWNEHRMSHFNKASRLFYSPDLIKQLEDKGQEYWCNERLTKSYHENFNYGYSKSSKEPPKESVMSSSSTAIVVGCILVTNITCIYDETMFCNYALTREMIEMGLGEEYIIKRINTIRFDTYRINKLEYDVSLAKELSEMDENALCAADKLENIGSYDYNSLMAVSDTLIDQWALLKSPESVAAGCIISKSNCSQILPPLVCKFRTAGHDTQEVDSEEIENNWSRPISAVMILAYLFNIFL